MVPCETNLRQQCQPDEEKNWERQFLALLTPALMGDPFMFRTDNIKGSVVERGGRLAVRVVVRKQNTMNNNTQLKGDR